MEKSKKDPNPSESSSEPEACLICIEEIELYGISPCGHNQICAQCHYQLRSKQKYECTFCKVKKNSFKFFFQRQKTLILFSV